MLFDLRFFVGSFSGYGLRANCIRILDEFWGLREVKKDV
jgi:hypothetical protein